MDYKQLSYELRVDTSYLNQQRIQATSDRESVLEKIASSYTKMPTIRSDKYNLDKCNCGNCGCLQGNLLLVLSPAGIAATISAFGPISAM
jgi:hypothetical protein